MKRLRVVVAICVVGLLFGTVGGAGVYRTTRSYKRLHGDGVSTPFSTPAPSRYRGGLVVAGHPEAARVGRETLEAGGSAIDAAIAVQLVLGLVEPAGSGIGGGAYLLHFDSERRLVTSHDGRETAPAATRPELLLDTAGEPLRFDRAVVGGRSVGVPGVVRMLADLHAKHGKLPWHRLFEAPIALAESGFALSAPLQGLLAVDPVLPSIPAMRSHYLDAAGRPGSVGRRLANPAYASTLEQLQRGGPDALYRGPIGEQVVAAVRDAVQPNTAQLVANAAWLGLGLAPWGTASQPAPGALTLEDLAGYRAMERENLCRPYRDVVVCSMGPSSSGGIAVLQILGVLEAFDLPRLPPRSPEAMHLFVEAQRLALSDRDRWLGDPDHVDVPTQGLVAPDYLAARRGQLDPERASTALQAGTPPGADARLRAAPSVDVPGTAHVAIVDGDGNAVSMTSSIEGPFGSHVMAGGFVLNNQLTDFSFAPRDGARDVANAPGPGRRPRSAMSPTIVLDRTTGDLRFLVGSAGGSHIAAYTAGTVMALVDWHLAPQQAVELPHVIARSDSVVVVDDRGWLDPAERSALIAGLEGRDHQVRGGAPWSGTHVIGCTLAGEPPQTA